jgi:hypothetical protein
MRSLSKRGQVQDPGTGDSRRLTPMPWRDAGFAGGMGVCGGAEDRGIALYQRAEVGAEWRVVDDGGTIVAVAMRTRGG